MVLVYIFVCYLNHRKPYLASSLVTCAFVSDNLVLQLRCEGNFAMAGTSNIHWYLLRTKLFQ